MKFSFRKMLACGLLAGAMTFCAAGAANFDNAAKSLSDLGLLTGTDAGFDLDRPSTRGEAAAMLVRLLGKEAEALEAWKTDEASFAFTDMDDAAWAKPYVNWLVKNSLAAGVTETTFAPRDTCSAQMAATLLLRALGYSDAEGGDFSYFTAMSFAREKGVVDLANCNEKDFQRDHLVAMCYTTLACQPKSGEADLLSKLVTDGAIADNDASKSVRQLFADYRDLSAAGTELSDTTAVAAKLDLDMGITVDGEKLALGMDQDIAAIVDPEAMDDMQMSMVGSMTIQDGADVMTVPNEIYYRDGVMYMNSEGSKMKFQSSVDDAMEQAQLFTVQDAANSQTISAVESLTKTTAGGKTTYVLTCNTKAMRGMIDTVLGSMMEALPDLDELPLDFSIDKAVVTQTVNAKGEPESMDMEIVMGMTVEDMTMQMELKMDMDITAFGDAVKVNFPADLDSYEDLLDQAAGLEDAA